MSPEVKVKPDSASEHSNQSILLGSERLGQKHPREGLLWERASALARQICDADPLVRPSLVCVYGPWGSGKTRFLNHLGDALTDSKHPVCAFPAWEYELEGDPATSFVRALCTANSYRMMVDVPKLSVPLAEQLKNGRVVAGKLIELMAGCALSAVPRPIAELLGGSLKTLLDAQAATLDIGKPVREVISEKMAAILESVLGKSEERLYILVDDLDRCSPESVVRMLEWFKVYFSHPRCCYILAVDIHAAIRAVNGRYGTLLGAESKDDPLGYVYLTKLFDIARRVPETQSSEAIALTSLGLSFESVAAWYAASVESGVPAEPLSALFTFSDASNPRTAIRGLARYVAATERFKARAREEYKRQDGETAVQQAYWLLVMCFLCEIRSPLHLQGLLVRGIEHTLKQSDHFSKYIEQNGGHFLPANQFIISAKNYATHNKINLQCRESLEFLVRCATEL